MTLKALVGNPITAACKGIVQAARVAAQAWSFKGDAFNEVLVRKH